MPMLVRSRRRPAPRGRALAVVLLVLAAICLIATIAGVLFARQGWAEVKTAIDAITARFQSGEGLVTVVVPGEATIESQPGAIVFMAGSSETIDGKTYRYPANPPISVSIAGPDGTPIAFNPFQGNQPPIDTGDGQKYLLGFAEVPSAGAYTITIDGGETAIRAFSMPTKEFEGLIKGGVGLAGGGLASICGGLGFLLFGILGGVLFLFGGKKKQIAA